ncbi:MAG: hypothetical protein ACOX36_01875 [Saccharofermentanales bacterium]
MGEYEALPIILLKTKRPSSGTADAFSCRRRAFLSVLWIFACYLTGDVVVLYMG